MYITARLETYLPSHEFTVGFRFSGCVNRNLSIVQHNADRIEVMTVQQNRIMRGYFDFVYIDVLVMKRKPMVRLRR